MEERLDRYMESDVWMNCWKEVRVFPSARYTSAHNPMELDFQNQILKKGRKRKKTKRYKFEKVWLNDVEGCQAVTKGWWCKGELVTRNLKRVSTNFLRNGGLPFWKNSKKSKRSEKEIALITKKRSK